MERLGQESTLHGAGKAAPRRGVEFVPGDRLGRYVIEATLGSGAMGVVLLARDPELDRPVAVKLIHQDMGGQRAQARFVREAQAMAAIDHPNVITVFDVGTHEGRVFIAMELVEGVTLEDWLQSRRSWQEVLEVFRAAGRGLAAAHEVDLIHRDFKLANVMVATDGRVKVMDFGLVRPAGLRLQRPLLPTVVEIREDAAVDLTRTGRVLGTPAYMAPEQHAGADLDPRSDQFSFGAALYEALYGQRAFRGETSGELAAAIRNAEIASPPSHTDVPAWVRDIVFRTLRPEPDERFASMHEVIEALAGNRRSGVSTGRLAAYGAMGIVVAGGITFLATDRPAVCAGGLEAFDDAWNARRAQLVREAFGRTELSYATKAADRTVGRLDEYRRRWIEVHDRLCGEAAGGEQAGATFDLRMHCLRDAKARVAAFVDALQDADAQLVDRAAFVASSLGPVHRCAEVDSGSSTSPALPEEPEARARIVAARTKLARCDALQEIGRVEQARQLADDAWQVAQQTGHRPLRAETRLCKSAISREQGQLALAEEHAASAFWEASEAGADRLAVKAAMRVMIIMEEQAKLEEAQQWAQHAQAALGRIPADAGLEAGLLDAWGHIYVSQGHFVEGQRHFERARDLFVQNYGDDHPLLSISYAHLSEAATRLGRYSEAVDYATKRLSIDERTYGPEHPTIADSLNNLGMIHYRHADHTKALEYFTRAVELWREHREGPHLSLAAYVNNRALALEALGRIDDAEKEYRQALAIREDTLGSDHPLVAHVVANLGNVAWRQERYEQAAEAYARAHSILLDALGPEHPDVAHASLNFGQILRHMNELERSRELLDGALSAFEASLGPTHTMVADTLEALGKLDERQGETSRALQRYERALAIHEQQDGPADARANVRFDVARLLWDTGTDRARARSEAARAHQELSELEVQDEEQLAEVAAWLEQRPMASRPPTQGRLRSAGR